MGHPGKTIRLMREAQSLGVNELARMAGVNAGYLSQVEQEKVAPTRRWLRAVTDALGRNLADRAS